MDLDDLPQKKTPTMVIGEPLDSISLSELAHRITQLEAEIARIRAEIAKKQASKAAAASFFKN